MTSSSGVQNLVGHPFDFDVCWADVWVIDGSSVLTLDEADPASECENVSPGPTCVMSSIMNKWNGTAYSPFNGRTPGAEGTLSAFFPHPDWAGRRGAYATDFRALKSRSKKDVWAFEVWGLPEVTEATLRWEGPSWALGGLKLTDEVTGRSVPMRPGGSYSFVLDGGRRAFSVRFAAAATAASRSPSVRSR